MKAENLMFAVIGLLLGLIIGFIGANTLNRSAISQASSTPGLLPSNAASNSELPPDHPPIGATANSDSEGPQPEVTAAIEQAKARPQDFEAQMTAADLYYQIQRFEEAAEFYKVAAKLRPNDAEASIKAGNSYFDAGGTAQQSGDNAAANKHFSEAEKWYTMALAKDPKNINVRTDLGLTFFLREPSDIDRAIKEYKTSLGIDPEHEVTLQNLALAYGEKGDTANQQSTLEKLRAVNPDNPILKRPKI